MPSRPTPSRVRGAASDIGEYLTTWRKLQGLTVQQVAERVGVTRQTIARLERGDTTVGLDIFLGVANALGQLDRVRLSVDPYETEVGRIRADAVLPRRVRHSSRRSP